MDAKLLSKVEWFEKDGKKYYKVNLMLPNGDVCTLCRDSEHLPGNNVTVIHITAEPAVKDGKLIGKVSVSW